MPTEVVLCPHNSYSGEALRSDRRWHLPSLAGAIKEVCPKSRVCLGR